MSGDCAGVPADVPRTGTVYATAECIWIELDGQLAATLWPAHYTATYSPTLTVFDESGRPVARGGERLTAVMLGPTPTDEDPCGFAAVVEVYIDEFATPPEPASS